jgi:hypothetical protein
VGDTFHHPTTTESNKIFAYGLTEVNITNVADLVKNDLRIASGMTAESLNIPKTIVLPILNRI